MRWFVRCQELDEGSAKNPEKGMSGKGADDVIINLPTSRALVYYLAKQKITHGRSVVFSCALS